MLEDGITVELDQKVADHLLAAGIDEEEFRGLVLRAVARTLYARNVLSLGLAADLAQVDRAAFMAEMAKAGAPVIDLRPGAVAAELDMLDTMLKRKQS